MKVTNWIAGSEDTILTKTSHTSKKKGLGLANKKKVRSLFFTTEFLPVQSLAVNGEQATQNCFIIFCNKIKHSKTTMPVTRLHLAQLFNMQKISALQNKINQSPTQWDWLHWEEGFLQRTCHTEQSLEIPGWQVRSKACTQSPHTRKKKIILWWVNRNSAQESQTDSEIAQAQHLQSCATALLTQPLHSD